MDWEVVQRRESPTNSGVGRKQQALVGWNPRRGHYQGGTHNEQESLMDRRASIALKTCGWKSAPNPTGLNITFDGVQDGFVVGAFLIQGPKPDHPPVVSRSPNYSKSSLFCPWHQSPIPTQLHLYSMPSPYQIHCADSQVIAPGFFSTEIPGNDSSSWELLCHFPDANAITISIQR